MTSNSPHEHDPADRAAHRPADSSVGPASPMDRADVGEGRRAKSLVFLAPLGFAVAALILLLIYFAFIH